MKTNKTIAFFDVDTQHDFMSPKGALYVRGARTISRNIRRLIASAAQQGIRIFSSTDAHVPGDPEMKVYPPHCIVGTPGQRKIPGTLLPDHAVVPTTRKLPQSELKCTLCHQQVILEKQAYDVFANPNTAPILRASGAKRFIVFGVATDYCVVAAVLGLRRRGYAATVVSDAIRGITPEGTEKALEGMRRAGAKFATTDEVVG